MAAKQVLFISYDGMTDPLGQSQVLPYLVGLSKLGYQFTLLSCEKPDRFEKNEAIIQQIVDQHKIDWQPISFTASPPILAKFYDLYRLEKKATELHETKKFALIHCRSYVSAAIGLKLKMKFGVKLIFDMRGFWVDERVDGGAWNLKNPMFKLAYNQYKKKEAAYIANSDGIVSLTEAGKREIVTWKSYQRAPISVIPCSADFDHFTLKTEVTKAEGRKLLNLNPEDLVVSYLGSVGVWYMLDEMLQLFSLIKQKYPQAKFLFITPDAAEEIYNAGKKYGLTEKDFAVKFASRKEVPVLIAASDINLFFIKQTYSKLASSPTKLGEILSMGIPVICNSKVGDVKEIVETAEAGLVIDDFSPQSFEAVVAAIPALLAKKPEQIREKALAYYDLANAVSNYGKLYRQVLG